MSTEMEKDGQTQTVPDDQVDQYLTAGWQPVDGRIPAFLSYEDPRTGERRLRAGRVSVDQYSQSLQAAADQGASITRRSPELEAIYNQQELQRREQQVAEREGPLQQFAFSTVDRLAFGGLSALTREISPEQYAQMQRSQDILSRQNPGVETAAQLASIGVPLLMGGAGFARALAGPTGLAMEAGALARAGLGRGLVGRVTSGALEGGLDLAISEAVDANIRNDFEGLSERMLSSGAMGALFGGVVEGGLFAREARARQRITRQLLGETSAARMAAQPPGVLRRIWDSATELISGNNPSRFRVRRMGNIPVTDDAAVAYAREVLENPGALVGPLADDVTEGLQAFRSARAELADARWVESPAAQQAWAASPGQNAAFQAVGNSAAEAQQVLRANRVSGEISTLADNVAEAAQKGDIRSLLAYREQVRSLVGTKGVSSDVARELSAGIDNGLQQAGGDFAALFKKRQDFLAAVDEMEAVAGRVFEVQQGVGKVQANKLKSLLDDFARSGDDQVTSALENLARADLLDDAIATFGLTKTGRLNPDLAGRVSRGADKWEAYQQFRNLELNVNSASGFAAAAGIGGAGVAYGLATDDPAAVAGGVAGGLAIASLSKPTGAARFMNTLRNLLRGQDARIQSSAVNVGRAMRGSDLPLSRIAPAAAAGKALLSDNRQEREQTYERMASRIEELLANPSSFYQAMLPEVNGADQVNPQLGMKMGMDSQRALQVLAENIPLSRRNRRRLPQIPSIQIPATDSEMDEFLEAAAVIEDPILSLDLFAAGRLSNTGARALQRAYPGFYRGMTSAVFQEYNQMVQEGQMPDFQASIRTATLFGFNIDPSLDPSMVLALQSNYSQTAEQERAIRSPDTVRREVNNLYASNNQTMSQGLQQ